MRGHLDLSQWILEQGSLSILLKDGSGISAFLPLTWFCQHICRSSRILSLPQALFSIMEYRSISQEMAVYATDIRVQPFRLEDHNLDEVGE
jgi:hypothetical protein